MSLKCNKNVKVMERRNGWKRRGLFLTFVRKKEIWNVTVAHRHTLILFTPLGGNFVFQLLLNQVFFSIEITISRTSFASYIRCLKNQEFSQPTKPSLTSHQDHFGSWGHNIIELEQNTEQCLFWGKKIRLSDIWLDYTILQILHWFYSTLFMFFPILFIRKSQLKFW